MRISDWSSDVCSSDLAMSQLVFLLEERSMQEVLMVLLPRLLPEHLPFSLIPHEGRTDLERSIPRKLRAWREPGARFVIVRDKDMGDCQKVKQKLSRLCEGAGRTDCLVRIVCHELESWFLGICMQSALHSPCPTSLHSLGRKSFGIRMTSRMLLRSWVSL